MAGQVFMCYARQDEDFVLKLAGALKGQGVPVWIDQWDIPGSADWDMAIEESLSKSSHMVVVLSPASMKSGEVRGEWRAALEAGKPIVPVLFQRCSVHRRLRLIQHIDFTSSSPTDADAVGQVVNALGMEGRASEKEQRPRAVSAEPSEDSGSERPVHREPEPVLVNGKARSPVTSPIDLDDRIEYNLRAIRELLLAVFNADELRALVAYDEELSPLRHEFSPSDAIIVMADKTIDFCLRFLLMEHLLSLVQGERPAQYERFEGRLRLYVG